MFQPVDKITRTPPSSVSRLQPDINSGPLSSTHIDSGSTGHSWVDSPVDPVAIRLFDHPIAGLFVSIVTIWAYNDLSNNCLLPHSSLWTHSCNDLQV